MSTHLKRWNITSGVSWREVFAARVFFFPLLWLLLNILNGIKQDNTVDLQLGQHIMIGTNPGWQMAALLAL